MQYVLFDPIMTMGVWIPDSTASLIVMVAVAVFI
jgi:hypothetical protein